MMAGLLLCEAKSGIEFSFTPHPVQHLVMGIPVVCLFYMYETFNPESNISYVTFQLHQSIKCTAFLKKPEAMTLWPHSGQF